MTAIHDGKSETTGGGKELPAPSPENKSLCDTMPPDHHTAPWWHTGLGGAIWLAYLLWSTADLATSILLFAPLVVVPLALARVEIFTQDHTLSFLYRAAKRLRLPASLSLIGAAALPTGAWSFALALPWAVFTWLLAAWAGWRIIRRAAGHRIMPTDKLCVDVGMLFLAVGSSWTLMFCLGRWPMGFETIIVQLTAIHFHYIGAGLMLLLAEAARQQSGRFMDGVAWSVIVNVPLLALGITFWPVVEVVAAVALAVSCGALAVVQLRIVSQTRRPATLMFLSVSSLALISGMSLAVVYTVGEFTGKAWIAIPEMIPLHGAANAFGFVLCGLLAWNLSEK